LHWASFRNADRPIRSFDPRLRKNRGADPLSPAGASPVAHDRPTVRCRRRRCWGGSLCGEGPDLGLGQKRGSPKRTAPVVCSTDGETTVRAWTGARQRGFSGGGGPVEFVEAFGGVGSTGEGWTTAGVRRLLDVRRLVGGRARRSTRAGNFPWGR
jgi:hypothetical protein